MPVKYVRYKYYLQGYPCVIEYAQGRCGAFHVDEAVIASFDGIAPSSLQNSSPTRSHLSAILAGLLFLHTVSKFHNWEPPPRLHILVGADHIADKLQEYTDGRTFDPNVSHFDVYTELMAAINHLDTWDILTFHPPVPQPKEKPRSGTLPRIRPTRPIDPVSSQHMCFTSIVQDRLYNYDTDDLQPTLNPITTTDNPITVAIDKDPIHHRHEFHLRCAARSPDMQSHLNTSNNWRGNKCDCIS